MPRFGESVAGGAALGKRAAKMLLEGCQAPGFIDLRGEITKSGMNTCARQIIELCRALVAKEGVVEKLKSLVLVPVYLCLVRDRNGKFFEQLEKLLNFVFVCFVRYQFFHWGHGSNIFRKQ
jgi:hypothetical protein